jgi:hypothetical protein
VLAQRSSLREAERRLSVLRIDEARDGNDRGQHAVGRLPLRKLCSKERRALLCHSRARGTRPHLQAARKH